MNSALRHLRGVLLAAGLLLLWSSVSTPTMVEAQTSGTLPIQGGWRAVDGSRAGFQEEMPVPEGIPGPNLSVPSRSRKVPTGDLLQDETWYEDEIWPEGRQAIEGNFADGACGCDPCGCDACGCGCGEAACQVCCDPCRRVGWWGHLRPQQFGILVGVHGFKGPPDQGRNGNFGLHEGLNFGGVLKPRWGLGYQFGVEWTQSNLSGDQVVTPTTDTRHQFFLTTGIFKKALCGCGWQGGVVVDILRDDYYVDMNLTQIRGELSYLYASRKELGFWFTAGTRRDSVNVNGFGEIWEPTDLYAFFYRRSFEEGAQIRGWAGLSGEGDGLLGGDMVLPLADCWGLLIDVNYLIPDEGGTVAASEESWALGLSLAWYPGGTSAGGRYSPMFRVANNATFMVDRRR